MLAPIHPNHFICFCVPRSLVQGPACDWLHLGKAAFYWFQQARKQMDLGEGAPKTPFIDDCKRDNWIYRVSPRLYTQQGRGNSSKGKWAAVGKYTLSKLNKCPLLGYTRSYMELKHKRHRKVQHFCLKHSKKSGLLSILRPLVALVPEVHRLTP